MKKDNNTYNHQKNDTKEKHIDEELWFSSLAADDTYTYNVDQAFDRFLNRSGIKTKKSFFRLYHKYIYSIAAILLLLLLIPISYYLENNKANMADNVKEQIDKTLDLYAEQAPLSQDNQIKVLLSPTEEVRVEGEKASITYSAQGTISINDKEHQQKTVETTADTLKVKESEYNQVIVPHGKFTSLMLSDGTKIYINSASRIVYPKVFQTDQRKIYVEGEAYLEVTKDKQKPFIVKTSSFEVKVLGTSFNVNAYKNEAKAEVVLLKGSIELSNKQSKSILLKPNQLAQVEEGEIKNIKKVNATDYIAWKDGLLILHSESLSSVCKRLERFYGCRISVSPQAGKLEMGGKIDLYQSMDDLMKLISSTAPIVWKKDKNGIYFIDAL